MATQSFHVTVRTASDIARYTTPADSAMGAFFAAAEAQGDTPCSITVTPAGLQ